MRSALFLGLGLTLVACGGTVTYGGDNDGIGGGESLDPDSGGGESADDGTGAGPSDLPGGEPGCFDASPGDGVGSSNCDPNFDHLDEPAACEAASCIVVTPSTSSPTDGCEWTLTCDGSLQLVVACDGENDGTNTSLCTCYIDGETAKDAGLVQGEGVDACLAAYINCLDPACAQ